MAQFTIAVHKIVHAERDWLAGALRVAVGDRGPAPRLHERIHHRDVLISFGPLATGVRELNPVGANAALFHTERHRDRVGAAAEFEN